MTSEPGSDESEQGGSAGEAASPNPSIWERMRRGMADHNAKAPRTPMGMPEVVADDDTDDAGTDTPEGATAELVLERIHHYRDTIRSYQVLIESQRVGQIRDDRTERFVLRPGSYMLRLRLMWIFSPKVVVELPAGTETRMICGPNGGILQAWRLFLAPTTAIFLRFAEEE
ncbi:hypothetical protein [Candidatus Poriferisodalis sp.]|uniref:hypothetical protein n=1 Tax=Candidatus Poriferisodalis sp. TaxID=3101277 RepID=UPI003B020EF0